MKGAWVLSGTFVALDAKGSPLSVPMPLNDLGGMALAKGWGLRITHAASGDLEVEIVNDEGTFTRLLRVPKPTRVRK